MAERLSERGAMDLILYYGREGLLHHMQNTAQGMLNLVGEHPVFRFWRGVALSMQENHTEAIRDYTTANGRREVQIAVIYAHMHSLKAQRQIDQDAINDLESKAMLEEKNATPCAWLQTTAFLYMTGDCVRARETCQKVPAGTGDDYLNTHSLMGWANLFSGRSAFVEKAMSNFEKAVDPAQGGVANHVDALLGKAAYLDQKRMYPQAIEVLNEVAASGQKGTEMGHAVQCEKAKTCVKRGEWTLASEGVQRILAKDPGHVQALMILSLYLSVEETRHNITANTLRELHKALQATEPRTHKLYAFISKALARLSGGSAQILQSTQALIARAATLQPRNAEYISEKAYQLSLAGEWAKALESFRLALQVDDGNLGALHGIIRSQLMLGKLDEAEQQLEFLNEMHISERPAELCYLIAVMKWRKHRDQAASLAALDEAVAIHSATVQGPPSYEFYEAFNPHLLLAIVREYLQHCPTEPVLPTDPPSAIASQVRKPLELLTKHVKGSLEGQLLLARLDFIQGDLEKAQYTINSCIRADATYAETHLLAAQIAFHQENYNQAQQALDQSMTEFEVRDWPQYNLLKAKVDSALGRYDDALKSLEHALTLTKHIVQGKRYRPLNVQDHVAIYLELGQVHLKQKNTAAASKAISEAMVQFRDTSEEGRVTIAHAMVVCKQDVDQGLTVLRSVPTSSPYFLKAKAHMASIYLNIRNNKRAFAKCYEDLVEAFPTAGSYLFLGEAYMSIQEPEKAIEAFEKARSLDPNNAEMAGKIGSAFVTTHNYNKAIQYYRNALKAEAHQPGLRHDLASLYCRLGKFQEAEDELQNSLSKGKGNSPEDLQNLMSDVRTMLLLAKVYRSSGRKEMACDALVQAKVFQVIVISKVRGDPDVVAAQRVIAANICVELGEYYRVEKATDKAIMFHNEALKQDETNARSMLSLAKIYRDKGDFDGCEHQANALLRVDSGNEEASMMLADLKFMESNFKAASYYYQQLLEKKPGNADALVHFVQLLRRSGRLFDAQRFLQAAEAHAPKTSSGLACAKGLYHRYTNNPREALREFNKGRYDRASPWAEVCTVNMVEIYLNPDNENQWTESDGEERQDLAENIGFAQKLLKDVRDPEKKKLLEGHARMARKRKEEVESALCIFEPMVSGEDNAGPTPDKLNVPAMVGMATALQLLKQTPKARNTLKRVAKAPYNQLEAEYFEAAWLLLADIHIAGGKYDLAQDLLRKCLQANKSCCRAWEFMGVIYEKEQSYRDAADCYENAWQLVNENDPGIGYKLAFNHLKARKFVAAIDVTQKVLASHSTYPKIRKDILDKARASLRP